MRRFTESVVEDATAGWLEALGYEALHGPAIAGGEIVAGRGDRGHGTVLIEDGFAKRPGVSTSGYRQIWLPVS